MALKNRRVRTGSVEMTDECMQKYAAFCDKYAGLDKNRFLSGLEACSSEGGMAVSIGCARSAAMWLPWLLSLSSVDFLGIRSFILDEIVKEKSERSSGPPAAPYDEGRPAYVGTTVFSRRILISFVTAVHRNSALLERSGLSAESEAAVSSFSQQDKKDMQALCSDAFYFLRRLSHDPGFFGHIVSIMEQAGRKYGFDPAP